MLFAFISTLVLTAKGKSRTFYKVALLRCAYEVFELAGEVETLPIDRRAFMVPVGLTANRSRLATRTRKLSRLASAGRFLFNPYAVFGRGQAQGRTS